MNGYERLRAMVEGKPVDRPGVTLWKHFYLEDRNVNDMVKRTSGFQDQNDWDLIKYMANAIFLQDQYGSDITWSRTNDEFPITNRHAVLSPKDFLRLKPVSVKTGPAAVQVEIVKRLVDRYHGKTPVLATVFTPLTYAQELYNGWQTPWLMSAMIKDYPKELETGVKVLTEVTLELVEEFIKAGVDGFFLASQLCGKQFCDAEDYKVLGVPYDMQVIDAFKDRTWFNMFHIHGVGDLHFDLVKDYPVQALNWEDILSTTSLKQAAESCDKILMGGIELHDDFLENDREKLFNRMVERVKAAAAQVDKNRLIIACGCSLPTDQPEYKYNTLREAVDYVYGNN